METNTTQSAAPAFGLKLPERPFVGLRPFNTDESMLFFGRREQTIELLERLHQHRFLAVVGSSGCGKSSLIRAGLIPKLLAGFLVEEREAWRIATLKPGDAPLHNLAKALSETNDESAIRNLKSAIEEGGAQAILEHLQPSLTLHKETGNANLLLLVDQFEEIFRFSGTDEKQSHPARREEAADFVALLLQLAEQRDVPVYVVLTMRSDFLGDCDNFHGLPEAFNRSQYLVPRLTREQRRQAIEGPIRLFGADISPALLDRLLNDVGEKGDQLPVMQHALMRTWDYAQFQGAMLINVEDYEAVGAIKNALSLDAEKALNEMSDEELRITEKMFQALTGIDARNRRVRRSVNVYELCQLTGASETQLNVIIQRFVDDGRSFLMRTLGRTNTDSIIDISHESLIRQWRTLQVWIDEELRSSRIYRRLAETAALYKEGKAGLWHDPDLQIAINWYNKFNPTEEWARRYNEKFSLSQKFLEESRKSRDKEVSIEKLTETLDWTKLLIGYESHAITNSLYTIRVAAQNLSHYIDEQYSDRANKMLDIIQGKAEEILLLIDSESSLLAENKEVVFVQPLIEEMIQRRVQEFSDISWRCMFEQATQTDLSVIMSREWLHAVLKLLLDNASEAVRGYPGTFRASISNDSSGLV